MAWRMKKPEIQEPEYHAVKEQIRVPKAEPAQVKEPTAERIQVVKELITKRTDNPDGSVTFTPLRSTIEDNTLIRFMTIEEALTLIMNEE